MVVPLTSTAYTVPSALGLHDVSAPVDVDQAAAPARATGVVRPTFRKSPPAYTTPDATAIDHTKLSGSGSHAPATPVAVSTTARKVRNWAPTAVNSPPR